jgi:hypothetical protein
MTSLVVSRFPHWRNSDGSFDSICAECMETVDIQSSEEDLQHAEDRHICSEPETPSSFYIRCERVIRKYSF